MSEDLSYLSLIEGKEVDELEFLPYTMDVTLGGRYCLVEQVEREI